MRRTFILVMLSQFAWAGAALAEPAPSAQAQTTVGPATSTIIAKTDGPVDPTISPAATSVVPGAGPVEVSGTTRTSWVNRPLLLTGLVVLGGSYATSAVVGAESGRPSDNPNLYYPVVGPWLDLAQRDCSLQFPCSKEAGNKALLIIDGTLQGLGALAVVTSFFLPEKVGRHFLIIGGDKLHASPSVVGSGYGLGAGGRF
jgi:hypothetical protein